MNDNLDVHYDYPEHQNFEDEVSGISETLLHVPKEFLEDAVAHAILNVLQVAFLRNVSRDAVESMVEESHSDYGPGSKNHVEWQELWASLSL